MTLDLTPHFIRVKKLQKRIDKDLNGAPLDPVEWPFDSINHMWTATKAAVRDDMAITSSMTAGLLPDALTLACLESDIELG